MTDWTPAQKPALLAETRLVDAILDGVFPVNSALPPERELAEQLGVTRPTLREVLQRLAREGWIEIKHGKSTRVRDYWREGNLLILSAVARHQTGQQGDFVPNLLHIRLLLAPEYTRLAIQRVSHEVIHILEPLPSLPDLPAAFAQADLDLHYQLTILSGNPVFTLILNGFRDLYLSMGNHYFTQVQARDHSRSFYRKLLSAVLSNDVYLAEQVTRQVMKDSMDIWKVSSK
jgi:GntR family transcriptional regulator, negative regulator for fad regulon and positive regulator of fabA